MKIKTLNVKGFYEEKNILFYGLSNVEKELIELKLFLAHEGSSNSISRLNFLSWCLLQNQNRNKTFKS